MRNQIHSSHYVDTDGVPIGGQTSGVGIEITWQSSPLKDGEAPTGAFVEGVITAALERVEFYQRTRAADVFNIGVIAALKEALNILEERHASRDSGGMLGKAASQGVAGQGQIGGHATRHGRRVKGNAEGSADM